VSVIDHLFVTKADVVARVRSDLALGHPHTAIQRLRTLLAVDPDDLEIHQLLAAVYREVGNPVEAGRWAFLTEDLRDEELGAFERANPDPWLRLRLIRWSGDPALVPDEAARDRLASLRVEAERAGPPERWSDNGSGPPRGNAIPCLFVVLSLVAVGSLVVIGVLRAVGLIVP
jgi:hypothetical protein